MRISKKQARESVKLVIFIVFALVLIGYLAARLGNISFISNRATYYGQLSDASGLVTTDPVKIAGVSVGEVSGITTQHGYALVTMSINRNIRFRSSTKIGLQWHNVIGEQFLYLYPGETGKYLKPGSTIVASHDVESANVGAFLNSLEPFLQSLNPSQVDEFVTSALESIGGNGGQINQLISSAATLSSSLGSLSGKVGNVINNMAKIFVAFAQRSNSLGNVVDNLQQISQSLASRNALLDSSVVNLSQVEGELATLLKSNQSNLNGSIDNLSSALDQIQQQDVPLAQGLSNVGEGLAPFQEISSYGQWFEIVTVYNCIANQTSCSYYEPSNPPAGSGPLGSPPQNGLPGSGQLGSIYPLDSSQLGSMPPSLSSVFDQIASGQSSFPPSSQGGVG
jgi:phospholipid/cholesterol/gamma-HCH transport system substrate-binding protein